ncbi:uncharacterized protein [Aristolochia californica]|uniref:uncharacterized protein n=1 Tax=Aristolochia californica TaxID=171875 RepID=UPI0035D7BF8A
MDFIDGLPKSSGKSIILVVADHFSKYGHFLPLSHPYTASHIAQIFMDHIVRLPESITSDRDAIFTSNFWKELFKLQGTKLSFSSAYHPQSDGQTEVVNRTLEMWSMVPHLVSYIAGSARVAAIDQALVERDCMLAQYRQLSLTASQCNKLSPKYYGPFQVLERIGSVAYRLQHPPDTQIHDVFYVSLLKNFKGDSPMLHTPLLALHDGRVLPTPAHVFQARRVNDSWEILVQWAETDPVEASWEPLVEFQALYPTFALEDKLFLQEGSDVMESIASRVTARHRT